MAKAKKNKDVTQSVEKDEPAPEEPAKDVPNGPGVDEAALAELLLLNGWATSLLSTDPYWFCQINRSSDIPSPFAKDADIDGKNSSEAVSRLWTEFRKKDVELLAVESKIPGAGFLARAELYSRSIESLHIRQVRAEEAELAIAV